ncbi:ATP-dependent RecD-like DNA helicase [Alistipes sp. ZOR0009]|uniref:ATP-dependent DNA helicase n=1 Tax=Alistipes sp. ZOR0009 TaxID=1339253 RepID=UPI000646BEEC|nr:AAA family ATPase [Alistipes sp. ZOR0009]
MIKNYIKELILKEFAFSPTDGQQRAIDSLASLVADDEIDYILKIQGYAGTGKTSLLAAFVKVMNAMGLKYELLGPTGRAAKVLSAYSGGNALTIHKKIYRQKTADDYLAKFTLDRNLANGTIFIVDEASMISDSSYESNFFGSGNLLDDLVTYVKAGKGCKLIVVGDSAQLPPVGKDSSPALDKRALSRFADVEEVWLKEVVRQAADSGILDNATALRMMIEEERIELPQFNLDGFVDIEKISGGDLIEKISDTYDSVGIENTMIVCRSNKLANRYNTGIRNRILYREEELVRGDLLMVVRNSYFWTEGFKELDFVANGDIVEVVRIRKYYERYGFRFAEVTVRLIDYGDLEMDCYILLNTLMSDSAALNQEESKSLFYQVAEDYAHIASKKKRYKEMRSDPFFNALQVKYANAVTCHKAQGGQWNTVFVDQGYFVEDMISKEYLRWLYTALTRATEKVYLVNFPDKCFK